jgi:hypothetical protein
MFLEIVQGILITVSLVLLLIAILESSKMISEKKKRQRMGLTDYYDRPIEKEKEEEK